MPAQELYRDYAYRETLPLSHGVGPDRHIVARCRDTECSREVVLDGPALLRAGWGGLRLCAVEPRLRCQGCGRIGARISIRKGPAP